MQKFTIRKQAYFRKCLSGLILSIGISTIFPSTAAELPKLDDAAILRQMPGQGLDYKMPKRIFTPEMIKKLRSNALCRGFLYRSFAKHADKWTAIPLERWQELISDFAPVSLLGNYGNPKTCGISPFTAKIFAGTVMSDEGFLTKPFQAKEKGTDFIIYAREKDMPADYPARPNRSVKIPHLDGSIREYRFFVPEKYKNAGPEFSSNRKNWFCPAGEVWRQRMIIIMLKVIPDLTAAVALNDNSKAARSLAAILDRLADIYPGLPLYSHTRAHGFARGPERKNYLTAKQYRSIASKQPFINVRDRKDYPFWYVNIYDFGYNKFIGPNGGWTDAVMDRLGWIASAFDAIRDRPETFAYSKAKYGSTDAWEKRFKKRCLKELEFLALATPPTTGNTSYAYINGAIKVGIATQNKALFNKGLEIIELYMYNNWSADGMAGDAAYNYAAMTQLGILRLSWLSDMYGGGDLSKLYPMKKNIDKLGIQPITTLLGVVSKHADQHSFIFRGYGKAPDKNALPYSKHESSMSLPFYGLTALRGGAPGKRMELIVSHQNAFQHSHSDRLGYQLFYEGIDCLPEFGYCISYIDPKKKPWSEFNTDYELMGLPNKDTDRWGPWKWGYADRPEAHNVLMVDNWLYQNTPCRISAFSGSSSMSDPAWWAQFGDFDAAALFIGRPNPVDIYSRQLSLLTLPDGSPLLFDVFRVKGGYRHDLFLHVPGKRPSNMPGEGKKLKSENLSKYHKLTINYDKVTGKSIRFYAKGGRNITDLIRYKLPEKTWYNEWLIQPSRTIPKQESARKKYGKWPEVLQDVSLGMWSFTSGSPARTKLICGRGAWPGGLTKKIPTIGLKDALDYRIQTRRAYEPGLESIFVSVVDARTKKQSAAVSDVSIDTDQSLSNGGGVVCRLKLPKGGTGVYASTLSGETLKKSNVSLKGRMGVLFPEASRLSLVDGTEFRADGWALKLEKGWKMPLAGVLGDLTGHKKSSLIVETDHPLPLDGALNGQFVYVTHKSNKNMQSVYTISGIARLDKKRWKISLDGNPPFITQRSTIMKIDPKDPRKMEQSFQFHLFGGELNVKGRRIRFPRSGYEAAMEKCGRSKFSILDKPPAGVIVKNDAFIVYSIQPGDSVVILNRFACRKVGNTKGGITLGVTSTGKASLTMPGKFTSATVVEKQTKLKLEVNGNSTIVKINTADLRNGKGTILLKH